MCYRLHLILYSLNTKVLWFLAHILSDFRIFSTFPIPNFQRFLSFEYFVCICAFSNWISTNGHVKFKLLFVYNCNETRTSHSPFVVYFNINISIIGRAKLLFLLFPLHFCCNYLRDIIFMSHALTSTIKWQGSTEYRVRGIRDRQPQHYRRCPDKNR